MKQKLNCIFLIDDNSDTNFLNSQIIKYADCAVATVAFTNAGDALACISKNARLPAADKRYIDPDLIFLDRSMPKMDGWDFIEAYCDLKADLNHKPIIVMLSASADPADEQRALSVPDISGFYAKPLSDEILNDVLEMYFLHHI